MRKLFEKAWFKWALIGGTSFLFLSVLSGFVVRAYLDKVHREEIIEAKLRAEREYEDKFRSAMTRIYQNLKLEHFLAAYKNLETLPEPKRSDALKVEEYMEVLNRVGNGLIQGHLLREAESVFLTIRNFEGQLTNANEALGKIESKRRVENAKFFLTSGDKLLGEKRYREANREFEKSQLELRSAEILQYDNVQDIWVDLMPKLHEARFFTLIDDGNDILKRAEGMLKDKKFKQVDQLISQAAVKVGRAAFLRAQAPEVQALRKRISNLDGELGYLIPNSMPIWNVYPTDEEQKNPYYFNLAGYELSPAINSDGQIKVKLQYFLNPISKFFVIRYRIFFYNGRDIFNGHYLMSSEETNASIDQIRTTTYLQEIPLELRAASIKRIEVRIYDENNRNVSRVIRAFRKAGA